MCRTCLHLVVVLAATLLVGNARGEQLLFYDFNDASDPSVAVDTSGKGNNGEVIEPAVFTPDGGGRSGKPGDRAMNFGTFNNGAYVDVVGATEGALDSISDHDQLTLAFWILGNNDQPRAQWTFYAGPGRQFGSHTPWENGNIYFDVAGCCGANTRIEKNEPDRSLYRGQWNHYAFVKNETYTAIYQNGELWHDSGADEKDPIGIIEEFYLGAGPADDRRSYSGLMDDVGLWDTALSDDEIRALAVGRPPYQVAGTVIGSQVLPTTRQNAVYGPPSAPEPGLLQEWYRGPNPNPGSKVAVDAVINSANPVVAPFRAAHGTTWWTGWEEPFGSLVKYPSEIQPQFNADNNEQYIVRATGELRIPESGTYRFADGVDDYTYLAIDIDNSGVAGDSAAEVLISDNTWTNVYRTENFGGDGWAEVEITVAPGGEWRAIEFNMAEGGGGDSGVIYWDYNPNAPAGQRLGGAEGFPELVTDPIDPIDAESMYIPDTHLRSVERTLLSADQVGSLPDSPAGFVFQINADSDRADRFQLNNPNPDVYTTVLNVDGVEFQLKVTGTLVPGDSFELVRANKIIGMPVLVPEVPGQIWSFNPATGRITYGVVVLPGDYNKNGVLDANDLDLQAAVMVNPPVPLPAEYDLDGDNDADIDDRVKWLHDLKNVYVGDADLNGEFNSADFVQVFIAGKYETQTLALWEEGDWDGNQVFDSGDFVAAFIDGGYETGPRPAGAVSAVPEPSSVVLVLLGLAGLLSAARRRSD